MSDDIRIKIVNDARKLFESYGLKSVSMDDIAKKLGMSKKTLYQYFDGKSQLIQTIIKAHMKEEALVINEIHNVSSDAIDEMIRIAKYVLQFMADLNPSLVFDLRKYYQDSWKIIEIDHMRFIEETIVNNVDRGIREGVYREGINKDIIGKMYVSNSMNIVQFEFENSKFLPAELYREMILYHLHGIMNKQGKLLFKQNKTSTYAEV